MGIADDRDPPDGPMTPEEQAVAKSLAPEIIQKIDAALLSHARIRERKVSMIVGLAMGNPEVRVQGLPDVFYAQRVKALVASGQLLAEGNLDYMRYSEVRLPDSKS
jgi:hypothetical protein